MVHRNLQKVPENSASKLRGLEVQSRQGGYREAGFHLPFDALCASLALTDELHVGSGCSAALVISTFQFSHRPVPRDALEPGGQAQPAVRRGRVRRAAQILHTSSCECSHARRRTERAVQLLIEELDGRRWCERSASSSAFARPLGGRPLGHLSTARQGSSAHAVGFFRSMPARIGRSHLEQLRRVLLSIWDHSSIWRAFPIQRVRLRRFLFSSSRISTRRSSA